MFPVTRGVTALECRATEMPILSAINESAPCMNQNQNEPIRDLRYWLDVWLGFVALVLMAVGIGHSLDWLKARKPIDGEITLGCLSGYSLIRRVFDFTRQLVPELFLTFRRIKIWCLGNFPMSDRAYIRI